MKRLSILPTLLALAFTPILTRQVEGGKAPATPACSITAFVSATDPEGVNLRSRPGTSHPIVGVLPGRGHHVDDPTIPAMVEVEITESHRGWFKVREARENEQLLGREPRELRAKGWISGMKIVVKTQAVEARERPTTKSKVLLKAPEGETLGDAFHDGGARMIECQGKWARIEFKVPGQSPIKGWVDRICPIQETTCSGF